MYNFTLDPNEIQKNKKRVCNFTLDPN